jgi:prepilin-type processing-associated H-X9-DG protein
MLIGIILYATLLGPSEATKRRRELAKCAENLRKLHLTMGLYANEHEGAFPAAADARRTADALRLLVPKYTTDTNFFNCPGDGAGYVYAMGLKQEGGRALLAADQLAASSQPIGGREIFPKPGNHGGRGGNLLFTDGHVETVGPDATRSIELPRGAKLLNP